MMNLRVPNYISSRAFRYAGRLPQEEFNRMTRGINSDININLKYFLQILGGDLWRELQERGGEDKHIEIEGPVEEKGIRK